MHLTYKSWLVVVSWFCLAGFSTPGLALLEECPKTTTVSPKKIAIFTDGTGNTKGDQTNVRRLYELVANQPGRKDLIAYYDRGVGNFGTLVTGGAVGLGFSRNVRQAYRCLAEHYRPGDQIYLFGFSRGAYTARVLGGLIRLMGVVQFPEGMPRFEQQALVEKIYDIYQKNQHPEFEAERQAFESHQRIEHPRIDVVGVWDTVAALGLTVAEEKLDEACVNNRILSWFARLLKLDESECMLGQARETLYQEYHQTGPEGIKKILHAVSIDEQRRAFEIRLYNYSDLTDGQILKQVWFAGVHSDVGGGYDDSDDLATISLNWMMQNLQGDGLLPAGVRLKGDPGGVLHTSRKSFYKLAEPLIREIGKGSAIHESVLARMQIEQLNSPNPEREPDGRYRPVQFDECLNGQPPSREVLSHCYLIVGDE